MIVGKALAGWLADEKEQARRTAETEDFARRFQAIPARAALEEGLRGAETGGADEILELARTFLEDDSGIRECVDEMIGAASRNPYFQPTLRTASTALHSGLLLYDGPRLTIMLAVMGPDAIAAKRVFRQGGASISFGGQKSLFRFLKAGGAVLSFWEAPDIGADFAGDATLRCRLTERRPIADGETLAIDGARQSFVIEHASSPLVYLQALTPLDAAPVMSEFDSITHAFAGASSTDDAGSRIGMMLSLLRVMDRKDAVPLFVGMLAAPHFYARWHAMREFLALDAQEALPHLRKMAEADPHQEVRAAASQTLRAFFPEQTAQQELAEQCPN